MVHMKAVRLHLTDKEIRLLERVCSMGFRSVPEVLRCAALSFADSKCLHVQSMEVDFDRYASATSQVPLHAARRHHQPMSGGELRAS
jgi:hypothetical protein